MKIICNETLYTYNLYHIAKAFYPNAEIEQHVDAEQEPLVKLMLDGGSCFSVVKRAAATPGGHYWTAGEGAMNLETDIPSEEAEILSEETAILIQDYESMSARERKALVTKLVYRFLEKESRCHLAWGMMTGVRPTKLAMQKMENGFTAKETVKFLKEEYYVSEEKAELAVDIAMREKELLNHLDYKDGFSLYIGIPFCPSICSYCSFSSSPLEQWRDRVDAYLDALCKEIRAIGELTKEKKLNTIYIGGGTPTTLEPNQLERLLCVVDETFSKEHLLEYTVEAGRPDSITREKLEVIRKYPVTRISVNPQTMQQKTLDLVGRKHTVQDVRNIFRMTRELGFDNINMDLIAGLPGETAEDMKDTLRQVEMLAPDSLTVHSLAIKRAARMGQEGKHANLHEEIAQMVEAAAHSAEKMELLPYYLYRQKNIAGNFENVGYAKVDKAGIYNILIMEEKQTIYAAGAGSTTKLVLPEKVRLANGKETNLIRVENVKEINEYINRIDEMIERKKQQTEKGEQLWH